ncbi:hypothetical protein [Streptomyces sp. NPDC101234]|uniref:hypothetical protein n=1 Tax=Streptomyces sp. NPDC101234 TaxID=3366138 RepID=UPI0038269144
MKRYLAATAGVMATACLVLTTVSAQPAAAAWRGCTALWSDGFEAPHAAASGGGDQSYTGKNSLADVSLYVKDLRADGHHVAVRLVTRRSDGSNHYWSWHHLYAGEGTDQTWNTTATDSGGIHTVWRQIGIFEGDSLLNSCVTDGESNPQW